MVTDNGYRLPNWMASVRFVYLPTPDQRSELMIIYGEDMDAMGEAIDNAMESGAESISWEEFDAPLVERARARITLEPLGQD